MAAIDLELVADHLRHRDLRRGVLRQHQPDLHMPAASAQVLDRVEAGRRVPERIDRYMRPTLGDLPYRFHHVGDATRIHRRDRAALARQRQLVFRHVDADHIGTQSGRDHDRRKPYPTATVYATQSPGPERAWSATARKEVANRQPRLAAVASSISSGNVTRLVSA